MEGPRARSGAAEQAPIPAGGPDLSSSPHKHSLGSPCRHHPRVHHWTPAAQGFENQLVFERKLPHRKRDPKICSACRTFAALPALGSPGVQGSLTVLRALRVVSSLEAATHPSSVEPPSHIPAKAAMLLQGEGQGWVPRCALHKYWIYTLNGDF